jgi:hypothetical protein
MPRTIRPVAPHGPGTDEELVAPRPAPRRQPRPPAAPAPAPPRRTPFVPAAEPTMLDALARAGLPPDARAQSEAALALVARLTPQARQLAVRLGRLHPASVQVLAQIIHRHAAVDRRRSREPLDTLPCTAEDE